MKTQKVVSDLLGSGLTQEQLADLMGCAQSTVSAFLNGKRGARVSHAIGTCLLTLHAERCVGNVAALADRSIPTRQAVDSGDTA